MIYLKIYLHNEIKNFTAKMIYNQVLTNKCEPGRQKYEASPTDKKATFCVNAQLGHK